jgi:AraC-like DNA-binding protein
VPVLHPDFLARICRFVESRGGDPRQALRLAGLGEARTGEEDIAGVPVPQAHWLLVALQRETSTPTFGLEAGLAAARPLPGPLGDALAAGACLRPGFELIERYAGLRSTCLRATLETRRGFASLVIEPAVMPAEFRRFVLDYAIGSVVRLARNIGEAQPCDLRLDLPWPRPAWHGAYGALADTVRFDEERLALHVTDAALDRPNPAAAPAAFEAARRACEAEHASREARPTMSPGIRRLLETMDPAALTLAGTACRAGVSERTIVRRLRQEGTSFQQLLDDVRREHAARMLETGRACVAEVALALGYASASNFGRSFRRWFGITPTAYLRRRRDSSFR